ncbi:MAG: DUF3343 domain-containing protein [Clostridiaceae bacterium]|jgi:hypothetical protein|nr:DUF3343 domain-containing protein [Clostridiaceae bacterium]
MKTYLITFSQTSQAIRGEGLLLDRGLSVKVIPLPSQIGAGCGICFRIQASELEEAGHCLREAGIEDIGIYEKTPKGYKEIER